MGMIDRVSRVLDAYPTATPVGRVSGPDIARQVSETNLRTCPYCGEGVDLLRCDIVATATRVSTAGRTPPAGPAGFDILDDEDSRPNDDASGDLPVLVKGRREDEATTRRTWREELAGAKRTGPKPVSLTQAGPTASIPRRLCEHCGSVLPPEMDTRATKLLAIAGINHAGKTHFLAQAFYEATRRGSLRPHGCTEFYPTEADDTATVLHNHYFSRLQRDRGLFEPTQEGMRPNQLTFAATFDDAPLMVVTHDVAGEVIAASSRRAIELGFLRRADAMIFLVDPLEFDAVYRRVPAELSGEARSAHQIDLLRQCLTELAETRGPDVPIRLVVSKADLLRDYLKIPGRWQQPATGSWTEDVAAVSDEVKQMLVDLDETELVHLLDQHTRVTYHAVSALGAAPVDGRPATGTPMRCSDPLATALYGMVHAPATQR